MDTVIDYLPEIGKAFTYTALLFIISAVLSLILGTILVAMRVGPVKVLRVTGTLYVNLVRNTPLAMIFFFFQFAAPRIGITFNWVDVHIGQFDFTSFFTAAVVSLTLYTSTFVCESLRSGINSVSLGQAEAARAIGLPFGGVMSQIVLPQAFRASVPPTASALIAMLKNTSVAAVFGVIEATSQMKSMTNDNADARLEIFIAFSIGYIVLVEVVSLIAGSMERRWRIA
ncbi:amino acid ABC transporter permease [Nocardioides insulae]|uniref:amino acid ABC transporter permease n=1 Tax=Nocardioides insulae TaxID=394734 RepID=UPI00041C64EA|nr:amino acid ABC transporter permease [Nocardioides insulae]